MLVSYLEAAIWRQFIRSLENASHYNSSLLLHVAVVSTARLFMSLPLVFPLTTAPVTKSGDTMLGLAVRKRQLDIIKYLVTECSVSVNGEQSVFVSPTTVVLEIYASIK